MYTFSVNGRAFFIALDDFHNKKKLVERIISSLLKTIIEVWDGELNRKKINKRRQLLATIDI